MKTKTIDPGTNDLPVPCRVVVSRERLQPLPAFRQNKRDDSHDARAPLFVWYQETPVGKELYLALYTRACEWARCTFCTLPTRSSSGPVTARDILAQAASAFEQLTAEQAGSVKRLFLSNNGSTLNPATMPREALSDILRLAHERLPELTIVCLETRFETVQVDDLVRLHRLLAELHRESPGRRAERSCQVQISAGYETQDAYLRNQILRKGYPEKQVQAFYARYAAASELCGERLLLDENVLLKPAAGMTSDEAVAEAVETILHVHRLGTHFKIPVSVRLHPTFVARGSLLARQFEQGHYQPPTLEDCVEVLRRVAALGVSLPVYVGLDDEGLAQEDGLFEAPLRHRKALMAFNSHQSVTRLFQDCQGDEKPMTTCVSTRSLRKANYVVREMARYYFPLYDIPAEDAFSYLSTLLICESIVFDVDLDLEKSQGEGLFDRVLRSRNQIAEHLSQEGLLDQAIEAELDNLVEYARLEHRLMSASLPGAEEIERACALRTSDIRLLHRVLVRMLGRDYNESYFELMWPLEAIMDIELDLEDYPRDLAENGFNTMILLQRLRGQEDGRQAVGSLLQGYEARFMERLLLSPPDTQRRFLGVLARYQTDHPRPALPTAQTKAASPRLL